MSPRLLAVTFSAHDPVRLARFWAGLLGRPADGTTVPGPDPEIGLRFVADTAEPLAVNRIHLHLTSTSLEDQQQTVATALRLGARHHDVGQLPEEEHVVLADPEGYEFCVIEPGNAYLAGCGLLGELACDGGREVGLFWSAALEWPLVWDSGEETAIQSPHGGTKIGWGGPPDAPHRRPARQRFELTPADGDQGAEVDRLVALGATRLGAGPDGAVVLADPGGDEFHVRVV